MWILVLTIHFNTHDMTTKDLKFESLEQCKEAQEFLNKRREGDYWFNSLCIPEDDNAKGLQEENDRLEKEIFKP